MGTVLVLIGFFAFIAAIVMLIISFIKKSDFKKWLKVMGVSFIVLIVGVVLMPTTTENKDNQLVNAEATATPESEQEERNYDGAYKFVGEMVVDYDGSNITIDTSIVPESDYTDIVVGEAGPDYQGNELVPGVYEFQFIEFPESGGSWYLYINDDIKVTGNPKASDYSSGNIYELNKGDVVSVENSSIATFYKVVK